MKQILIIIPYLPNIEALLNKSLILEGSDRPTDPPTVPWRSQNIEHHRTPELFGHPAKIHYLDNWNSFSNSCHVMPWLVYSMMEKNDTVKTEIFEKINAMFFSPSNVPSKISISKIKFLVFLWLFFGYWPQLWC